MKAKEVLASVAVISILVMSWSAVYVDYKECEFNGGDYVKGAIWFTCINTEKEG